jgi:hypothetical protein
LTIPYIFIDLYRKFIMQRRTLATALQALILSTSALAALHAETVDARTVTEPRSVYSDGARSVEEKRSV